MKRKFEEVLEECLSALLEGRRSIDQSASLYPDLAPELVPLLRTASGVSGAFENLNPPPYIAERGRLRFLTAASERRRAREIAGSVWGFKRTRLPRNFRQWGLLGAGVAAAFAALVAGAVMLAAGGGGDDGRSSAGHFTATPTSVAHARFAASIGQFRTQLDRAQQRALQGNIRAEDLEGLRQAASQLAESGQPPDAESRQAVEDALNDQYAFMIDVADDVPPELAPPVQDVLSSTKKAADDLGVAIFTAQPTPTPTEPPPTTETPGVTVTDTPVPSVPATETPAQTEEPTPTSTPPLQGLE